MSISSPEVIQGIFSVILGLITLWFGVIKSWWAKRTKKIDRNADVEIAQITDRARMVEELWNRNVALEARVEALIKERTDLTQKVLELQFELRREIESRKELEEQLIEVRSEVRSRANNA